VQFDSGVSLETPEVLGAEPATRQLHLGAEPERGNFIWAPSPQRGNFIWAPSPRSGWQNKAWGASPRFALSIEALSP
jgi:hypothetical protein